jgi:hypothetical protein
MKRRILIDIPTYLAALSEERPVFHSEADFQLAFGWLLQRCLPGADVRLEWRTPLLDRRLYLDIYLEVDGEKWGIELKYKTRPIATTVRGELFELKSHGAQDLGRYDYLRDLERLETLKSLGVIDAGAAILLTNDTAYWTGSSAAYAYASFGLTECRSLSGKLAWGPTAGPGTTRKREAPISIVGEHVVKWSEYSKIDARIAGQIRSLVIQV